MVGIRGWAKQKKCSEFLTLGPIVSKLTYSGGVLLLYGNVSFLWQIIPECSQWLWSQY